MAVSSSPIAAPTANRAATPLPASASTRRNLTPRGRRTRRSSTEPTMPGEVSARAARQGFLQLQERQRDRADKRALHRNDPLPISDDEEDLQHPMLNVFHETVGKEGVLRMTNFTPSELVRLYGFVAEYMASRWNVGKSKRSTKTAIDVFFMTLSVLKHGGDWALLASTFAVKPAAFEKMIVRFLDLLSPRLYAMYVEAAATSDTYKKLVTSGHAFEHYPAARYAVDVTFQQSSIKTGSQEERAVF